MSAFMGGLQIVSLAFASSRGLVCRFRSIHDQCWHQLYAGRTQIGISTPGQRTLVGQLQAARYPERLTLMAVEIPDRMDDFGDELPPRPFNRARLRFTASGFPTDTEFLDITAGEEPGDPVDDSNRIGRLLYVGSTQYEFISDPLPGGEWNFEITGRDNRPRDGNAGTSVPASLTVLAHPPDVRITGGDRLSVDVLNSVATVTATVPED